MKAKWNQTGRRTSFFIFRQPPGSALLQLILLFSLLTLWPACLLSSCGRLSADGDVQLIEVPVDSCHICLRFKIDDFLADSVHAVKRLDVLLYGADGIKELKAKRVYSFLPDSAVIYCAHEELLAVAVANFPEQLFQSPPSRYDGAEQLSCRFEADSPRLPLMSGTAVIEAGASGTVTLTPLMARVKLGVISNNMKKYVRLEDPRIFLENANAGAEILREGGFRPSEVLQETPKTALPYDIGVFAQSPGTELYCYPNDSPEATIGTPATVFVLECEISGVTRQFKTNLPAICRNSTTLVDISVDGPEQYESKVY